MKCAVNYAFANRLVMTQWIRDTFEKVFGRSWQDMEMETVYAIAHNIVKLEKIGGKEMYIEYYEPKTETSQIDFAVKKICYFFSDGRFINIPDPSKKKKKMK